MSEIDLLERIKDIAREVRELRRQLRRNPGKLTTFTPAWTGSITNPAIGNGTLEGRYIDYGAVALLEINMTMGSTTTFGSGYWIWSLPVNQISGLSTPGPAWAQDVGAHDYFGEVRITSPALCVCYWPVVSQIYSSAGTSSIPFTWGDGDKLSFTLEIFKT